MRFSPADDITLVCHPSSHHYDPERTIMIGDNLETDVLFGINCDIATLLVMTGKSHAKAIATITASVAKVNEPLCMV